MKIGRKIARNVVTLATTGEAPAAAPVATPTSPETSEADPSELFKSLQEAVSNFTYSFNYFFIRQVFFHDTSLYNQLIFLIDRFIIISGDL